jgi:hypothetical protein
MLLDNQKPTRPKGGKRDRVEVCRITRLTLSFAFAFRLEIVKSNFARIFEGS